MPSTMALLDKALTVKRARVWARELNLSESTFSTAKKRGRLSPTLAGSLAAALDEDPAKWIALAGLEAEPDTPLRDRVLHAIDRAWRHS